MNEKSKADTWTAEELTQVLRKDTDKEKVKLSSSKHREKKLSSKYSPMNKIKEENLKKRPKDEDSERRKRREEDRERKKLKNEESEGRRKKNEDHESRKKKEGERDHRRLRDEEREHKKKKEHEPRRQKDEEPERRKRKDEERERRRLKDEDPERRKRKEEERERRRLKDEDPERRKRKEEDPERRKRKEEDPERRNRKEEDPERRKRKEEERERRRLKDEDPERRKRKEEERERRRQKDEDPERRKKKEEDPERRKRKEEDPERRKRKEEDPERRRLKDEDPERRKRKEEERERRRQKDEDPERRKRKDEERERRRKDEERERRRKDENEAKHESRDRRNNYQSDGDYKRDNKKVQPIRNVDESSEVTAKEIDDAFAKKEINAAIVPDNKGQEENIEAEDEYNYDDDEFEDYEDDFDEDIPEDEIGDTKKPLSEMNAVIRAINQENEQIANSSLKYSKDSDEEKSSDAASYSPYNFTSTINFSKINSKKKPFNLLEEKMMKRKNDLVSLIQLDVVSFDLFELKPITEYGFYIKNFGSYNTRQIASQCNDDALNVDIQTEEIEVVEKWSQHPQEGAVASGAMIKSLFGGDGEDFISFIHYSSRLVEIMMNESTVWGVPTNGQKSRLRSCENYLKYNNKNNKESYLQDRQVCFCDYLDGVLIVALTPQLEKNEQKISKNGLITIWKSTDQEKPEKVLLCDGVPTVCCYTNYKHEMVFVGTNVGCILAYDLNEPASMHSIIHTDKSSYNVLRHPTYTTGWIKASHTSPIVSVSCVGNFNKSNQIFSVDEQGHLCIWVVTETLSSVDEDIGLAPCAKIKLMKSTSTATYSSSDNEIVATYAICPDSSTFFIGTDISEVRSRTRSKKLRTYYHPTSMSLSEVTCISFNPFIPSLMIIGYSDGSVAMFNTNSSASIMSWNLDASRILNCDWSNCRSSVYFALDSNSYLHTFDLMAIDSSPVVSDKVEKKVIGMNVNREKSKNTDLMLVFENGSFQSHRVKTNFSYWASSEEGHENKQLMHLITSFAR